MSKDNPISGMITWYKTHGPRPLLSAALLGLGAGGVASLAWNPVMETVRSIGRPFARKMNGADPNKPAGQVDMDWDERVDSIRDNSRWRLWAPALLGLGVFGATAGLMHMKNKQNGGLTDWFAPNRAVIDNARSCKHPFKVPLVKRASIPSYYQTIDWNKPVRRDVATSMFNNDPHLADMPDARLTGLAIVNNAALQQRTNTPTLGGIFDSAIGKIDKKLTFGGMLSTAARTVVANSAARLFTGALGTVCDLSPKTRQNLIDAGTWAGAVTSILR